MADRKVSVEFEKKKFYFVFNSDSETIRGLTIVNTETYSIFEQNDSDWESVSTHDVMSKLRYLIILADPSAVKADTMEELIEKTSNPEAKEWLIKNFI